MIRLFIAFPLPDPVKLELGKIILSLKQRGGSVKWVESGNIHLTAKFLGNTDDKLVKSISDEIDNIAKSYFPVETTMSHLGAFPNLLRPRVIWIGLDKNIETLAKIALNTEEVMQKLGFPAEDKRFKAHLTLGRIRENRNLGNLTDFMKTYKVNEMPFRFDSLVLFKSTLTPRGPIYERLHESLLGR